MKAAKAKSRLSYDDFDGKFAEELQKYYKKPGADEKSLRLLYIKTKPSKKFHEKLQKLFSLNEARLQKMIHGWLHKVAEPWPKEILDKICTEIPVMFKKFYSTKINKKQICDLIQDAVIEEFKLSESKFEVYDHNYINRLIYGKTMEICKTYEPKSDSEDE